jgi:hypothetical protein
VVELPDRVRAACGQVAAQARSVQIDQERIASYAAGFPTAVEVPGLEPDAHYLEGPPESVTAFVLCLDAINFGSGYWPTIVKRQGRSGYLSMATGLAEHFRTRGPWSADELAAMETPEIAAVVGQDSAHELMTLFTTALRDLGIHVRDEAGGRFERIVEEAGGSAVSLATRLSGWGCFTDTSPYGELTVPFFKRAQLTASDLQGAGVVVFTDLDRLTAFADNLIPHVLILDGVLQIDPALAGRIEDGQLLAHDAPEEVELRACTVHAIELLTAACGHRLSPAQIDMLLWTRGQEPRFKARPRPRARSTAY